MASMFHPVLHLPFGAPILNLSRSDSEAYRSVWSIGRYDENRVIYTAPLFGGKRTWHLGIDLGGPAGTPVYAPCDGFVLHAGENRSPGDYGPTLVTEHCVDGAPLWILFGHLSRASLAHSHVGRKLVGGDVMGWLGVFHENGGYPPHVHVQLAIERPVTYDLPGAVDPAEREAALRLYPDPRRILGPLY